MVQVICRIADLAEWVIAGNVELLRAGWLQAPLMTALQACRDAGQDYAWTGSDTAVTIVELKPLPSILELLEEMYKEGEQRASSDGLLKLLEVLF